MSGRYITEGGYAEIQKRNGVMVYDAPIFADIQINRWSLHTTLELLDNYRTHNTIFNVKNGNVTKISIVNGKIEREEYAYVHFQQRKLTIAIELDATDFLVVPPNRAINKGEKELSMKEIKRLTRGNILSWNFKRQLKLAVYLIYRKLKTHK